MVKLCLDSHSPSLVMLSALTAAQNKIHPRLSSGFCRYSYRNVALASSGYCLRPLQIWSHQQQYSALSASLQFDELLNMVNAISSRSFWAITGSLNRTKHVLLGAFSDDSQKATSLILTQTTGLQSQNPYQARRLMFVVSRQRTNRVEPQLISLRRA